MERRRRAPRVETTGWFGNYTDLDNERYCRVIDISVLGIGLELFGDVPGDLIGHRLSIEIQAPIGESVRLHLVGTVKNVSPNSYGAIRAGLEFIDLSDTERSNLEAMDLLGVVGNDYRCVPTGNGGV